MLPKGLRNLKFKVNDYRDFAEVRIIKSKIEQVEADINEGFMQYGKAVYHRGSSDEQASDIKNMIDMKLENKAGLKKQLYSLENEIKNKKILQERNEFEDDVTKQKEILEDALHMGLLTQEQFDDKIYKLDKLLISFMDIRTIEEKFEMGLISEEERNRELENLL